jgi:cyclopropane fatty-acyl-phospholipid synthase-like methyltransferase
MKIEDFYSDTDPELWKKVLGEDLHYHVGWGDGDIMYNAVQHLYQFLKPNSKILDCGCGWGGPAKVIQKDLGCEVISITNSKRQYEYVKENISENVILCDLLDYNFNQVYDSIVFIESFCHLYQPDSVLTQLSKSSNQIIVRDYYLKTDISHCEKYLNNFLMKTYSKDKWIDMFKSHNFDLIYFEDHYDYALEPTLDYWLNNLSTIQKNQKTKHLQTLEISSRYLKRNLKNVLSGVGLSTFVFKK